MAAVDAQTGTLRGLIFYLFKWSTSKTTGLDKSLNFHVLTNRDLISGGGHD